VSDSSTKKKLVSMSRKKKTQLKNAFNRIPNLTQIINKETEQGGREWNFFPVAASMVAGGGECFRS